MASMPEKFMKQVKLGNDTYELIAGYLNDGAGGAKNWADVEALVTAGFTITTPWTKTDYESTTAPTAAKLATVPAVTVYYNNGATEATGTLSAALTESKKHIYLVYHPHEDGADKFDEYVANTDDTWEKIGNTDIDLSDYAKKGLYYGTAAESGAHTHTVTGQTAVPTVTTTDKHLGISQSTNVTLNTDSKSTVLTGVKVSTTDEVLGSATTFAVSGGALSGASQAAWSAAVDADGVLTFSFTPNNVGSVTSIGVTANNDDRVNAATAVAGDGTASALTNVTVATQPNFTLDNSAATGVAYVESVTVGSQNVALESGAAASAGAHTHTTSVTLNEPSTDTNPMTAAQATAAGYSWEQI